MPSPERSSYFPAIERKHGQPMSYWFERMADISDRKYPEQMAYLQEEHGFSRTHANALIQYCRGSTSSRRFSSLDQYLAGHPEQAQATVRAIFAAIQEEHPDLDLVIAWNQPMLKADGHYVFGLSVLKRYILMAPHGTTVLEQFRPRLEAAGFTLNKKTIQVPFGWDVDAALLNDMVDARLAENDAAAV